MSRLVGCVDGPEEGAGEEVIAYDPFAIEEEGGGEGEGETALITGGGYGDEDDDDLYEDDSDQEAGEAEGACTTLNGIDIPPVPTYLPPTFKIIAYDPKTRRKLVLPVACDALLEIAGGVHSQYLAPERYHRCPSESWRLTLPSILLFFNPSSASPSYSLHPHHPSL